MKRSAPIQRRTPLKRTPLKQGPGRKARREESAWKSCRDLVRVRSHGECEAAARISRLASVNPDDWRALHLAGCYLDVRHAGSDCHHIWPEDRDLGQHDPGRVILLCPHAHRWAHAHPAAAGRLGLLRPERNKP